MTELAPIPMAARDDTAGFARGWYAVMESEDLAADAMVPLAVLGEQLIAFRDADGAARVADAFCPHLGAHLASFDGRIDGGEIVCPFHKWRFSAETGKCTAIPYSRVIPPQAALTMYPACEFAGMVMLWWDPAGGAPDYQPYDLRAAHDDRRWLRYADKRREGRAPFRDLFENLFDTAHIEQLHGSVGLPEIDAVTRMPWGLKVDYAPSPEQQFPIRHMQFNFSGISFMSHVVLGDGFGFIQNVSATPIDRERFQLHVRMYIADTGSDEMNQMVGGAFAQRVLSEIDQDFEVLDYKKHLKRPLICAGDGPIMRYRDYAREFLPA
jgi:nitrite reductase/ring-hydroxylating ferredoxin subunit